MFIKVIPACPEIRGSYKFYSSKEPHKNSPGMYCLIYFVVHLAETICYNTIKLSRFEVHDLHRQHNLPLKLSKMYRL